MKKRITSAVVLMLSLGGGMAVANNYDSMDRYDLDRDGAISKVEFDSYMARSGQFSDWDQDKDGMLDENEFPDTGVSGKYKDYAQNTDQGVSQARMSDNIFRQYDIDKDNKLDSTEWSNLKRSGVIDDK